MPTTHEGVDNDTAMSAEDTFLKRWEDAGLLSDGDEGVTANPNKGSEIEPEDEAEDGTQDDLEDIDLEEEGEDSDEEEGDDDQAKVEAPDDALVTIKIGDETQTVKVKDLKRLYGQEASLTRKSQEVAQARQKVEQEGELFAATSQRMLEKAEARFQPYKDIDWLVAQKNLTATEFAALRQEAQAAFEDYKFLQEETNSVFEQLQQSKQAQWAEEAKECVKVLAETVPNWSAERYSKVRDFAKERGIPSETFNQIVDPVAIAIINDALTLHEARQRAATKKKTVAVAPKKTVKQTKGRGQTTSKTGQDQEVTALAKKLRSSGKDSDAEALFLARWSAASGDD
jgi:hypothetical protein